MDPVRLKLDQEQFFSSGLRSLEHISNEVGKELDELILGLLVGSVG